MNTERETEELAFYPAKVIDNQPIEPPRIIGNNLSTIVNLIPVRHPVSAKRFLLYSGTYEPPKQDYTDLGQSKLFSEEFDKIARYSDGTSWIVYDGTVWQESESLALGLSQELTHRQRNEAEVYLDLCSQQLAQSAKRYGTPTEEAKKRFERACLYSNYVKKRRQHSRLMATLNEAVPSLYLEMKYLDADPFLLNTPTGTIDLRNGTLLDHKPENFITKCTSISPSSDGKEIFDNFLHQITDGDEELQRYLQEIAGMFAIGRVYYECIIIAYGEGGNGKSTFFNLLCRVLGQYASRIPTELLVHRKNRNKQPAKALLRGLRLAVACELEEGEQLDTGLVKQISSTDPIDAEPKYKKPFSFIPSHSTVLFTNHLPAISATDNGTWDRIVAIPFTARFRNTQSEIKHYDDFLYDNCGGAVLQWIIEGAKIFIRHDYKISQPDCIKNAIAEYRQNSDVILRFINECCDKGPDKKIMSSQLYNSYKEYCTLIAERPKSDVKFKEAIERLGYNYVRTGKGIFCYGLANVK